MRRTKQQDVWVTTPAWLFTSLLPLPPPQPSCPTWSRLGIGAMGVDVRCPSAFALLRGCDTG
jgi:hypothetical protein